MLINLLVIFEILKFVKLLVKINFINYAYYFFTNK